MSVIAKAKTQNSPTVVITVFIFYRWLFLLFVALHPPFSIAVPTLEEQHNITIKYIFALKKIIYFTVAILYFINKQWNLSRQK
jgi:hypothetical protein